MFRFVLQTAFIRRVLRVPFVKTVFLVLMLGALAAGVIYAVAVFHAVAERNQVPHVQPHSSN
jgi:hypothetical protein